jgi:hypothetical protein
VTVPYPCAPQPKTMIDVFWFRHGAAFSSRPEFPGTGLAGVKDSLGPQGYRKLGGCKASVKAASRLPRVAMLVSQCDEPAALSSN